MHARTRSPRRYAYTNALRVASPVCCSLMFAAEMTTTVDSNIVTVDETPPVIIYARDSIDMALVPFLSDGDDVSFVAALSFEYHLLFEAYDLESDILVERCAMCVGSFPGACDSGEAQVVDYRLRDGPMSLSNLVDGVTYYTNLFIFNGAGNYNQVVTDGFTIDVTAPYCGKVLDGPSFDRYFVGPTLSIDLIWLTEERRNAIAYLPVTWLRFVDYGAGIERYMVAIVAEEDLGRVRNLTDVFVDVSVAMSANVETRLDHAVTYHSVVSVHDRLGNQRFCYSDGVLFDATAPNVTNASLSSSLAYAYTDGIPVQRVTHLVQVQVQGIVDPESGIREYFAALSLPFYGSDAESYVPYRSLGSDTSVLIGAIALEDGNATLTVRAVNGAFEVAEVALLIGVDSTGPSCSAVSVLNATTFALTDELSFQFTTDPTHVTASWECVDAAPWSHAPLSCAWAVGTYAGGSNTRNWTAAESSGVHTWYEDGAELLENGITYFVSVRCTDHVDHVTIATSSGLQPDLLPPAIAIDARVVYPSSGLSAEFWASTTALDAIWGFDDFETGVKSIRAAVMPTGVTLAAEQLPLVLVDGLYPNLGAMSGVTDPREATIDLEALASSSNFSFEHAQDYVLWICASDFVENWACSSYGFTFDLTPPVCEYVHDLVSAIVYNGTFSVREGYAAEWYCYDPESGVSGSSWAPYRGYVDSVGVDAIEGLLSRRVLEPYALGSASVATTLIHASRYFSGVTATNGAGVGSSESFSAGVTFDATPPTLSSGGAVQDFAGARYRRSGTELCTEWSELQEDISNLAELEWQLIKYDWETDSESVLDSTTLTSGFAVGEFQCRTLNASFVHRGVYYSKLLVSNDAFPSRVAEFRASSFIVDDTAPETGLVALSPFFPDGFHLQPTFPAHVTDLVVRVWLPGFVDTESGLEMREVVIYADGIEIDRSNVSAAGDQYYSPSLPPIANNTVLVAKVVATNRVSLRSSASSEAVTVSLGALTLNSPWLLGADSDEQPSGRVLPLIKDTMNATSLSIGFQLASDPVNVFATLSEAVGLTYQYNILEGCDKPILPIDAAVELEGYEASVSVATTFQDFGPKVDGQAVAGWLTSSATVRATSFSLSLVHGASYCTLVTACALGTDSVPSRCVNAISDPVVFDETPPTVALGTPIPSSSASGPTLPFRARLSCADAESGLAAGVAAVVSVGTDDDPGALIDALYIHSTLANGTNATMNGTQVSLVTLTSTSFTGTLTITEQMLIDRFGVSGDVLGALLDGKRIGECSSLNEDPARTPPRHALRHTRAQMSLLDCRSGHHGVQQSARHGYSRTIGANAL